jgi:sec-independent protein translocase protein TatB
MPDLAWSEILALIVIAIVVVGPRELPGLMRKVAQFTRAARQAAQEFRDSLDELALEVELDEVKRGRPPVNYDTEEAVVDPTTGHSISRKGTLSDKDAPYTPPVEEDDESPATARRS